MRFLRYLSSIELYYFSLFLFAASLPLSKFTISLSQFIIVGNWILQGNYSQRIKQFKQNKVAVILCSLYLLHVIGLLYTTDFPFAFKDLKTKSPILILPFIVASSPAISKKMLNQLLFTIWGAVVISTLICLGFYLEIGGTEITDIRQISPLISHIRLALLICVSCGIAGYFIKTELPLISWVQNNRKTWLAVLAISIGWFVIFLIILESLTGLLILFLGTALYSIYAAYQTKKIAINIAVYGTLLFILSISFYFIKKETKLLLAEPKIDYKLLPVRTINGNLYSHIQEDKFTENGHYYGLYNSDKELKSEWDKRSSLIKFDSLDLKKQLVNNTIKRYLTSKGLSKDSLGVWQLNAKEINEIQKGITNYRLTKMNPIQLRFYDIAYEYQTYKSGYNRSGHSLSMRLEYWHTAIQLIKKNVLFGVGTGDLEIAFAEQYQLDKTQLTMEFRNRAHNQYLTMFVAFGILGFLWFLTWLFF
jgi:hypothetical protein